MGVGLDVPIFTFDFFRDRIYILYKREVSVCLSVCLFVCLFAFGTLRELVLISTQHLYVKHTAVKFFAHFGISVTSIFWENS